MIRYYMAVLLMTFATFRAAASPFDDLKSPDPAVRDAAAEQIKMQKLYHPTDKARWENAKLSKGDTVEEMLQKLEAAGATWLSQMSSAQIKDYANASFTMQIDDSWDLQGHTQDGQLKFWRLVDSPRFVDVEPPAHYTGKWVLYHLDGSSVEINVSDGKKMPQ